MLGRLRIVNRNPWKPQEKSLRLQAFVGHNKPPRSIPCHGEPRTLVRGSFSYQARVFYVPLFGMARLQCFAHCAQTLLPQLVVSFLWLALRLLQCGLSPLVSHILDMWVASSLRGEAPLDGLSARLSILETRAKETRSSWSEKILTLARQEDNRPKSAG